MKINSIQPNSTKANFKALEENTYRTTSDKVKDITDKYIEKDDIKSPGQIAFSMALIGLKTFICGAGVAALIAGIFKSAPGKTQEILKNASEGLIKFSKNVVEEPTTKVQKFTNFAKKAVGKTEEIARDVYKKVICRGFKAIPEGVEETIKQEITNENNIKAFTRLGGASALAALTPGLLTRDKDGDGVHDIVQKAQRKSEQLDKRFNTFGEDVLAMTQLASLIK